MKRSRRRNRAVDPWQAAARAGCDVALLEDSMRRTPAQRVAAHRSALNLATKLRAAMEQRNARS